MTYEQCECEVRQRLSEKRFYHSQCVAEEAVRLAVLYGADPEKARLAGLLHDILKDTPAEEQLKILQGFGIMMNDTELANQKLWHAISGAAFLEFGLGIRDRGNSSRDDTAVSRIFRENSVRGRKCVV